MTKPKKPRSTSRAKVVQSKSIKRFRSLSLPQLIVFILVFASIGTYLIFQSFASPSSSIVSWNRYTDTFLSPLDGQGTPTSPVYNTTGCAWNDQDNIVNLGRGSLSGSTSNTICLVADYDDSSRGNYPKDIVFNVYAASDSLDVSLTNDAGNTWHAPPSTVVGSQRLWQMCVADPVADAANVEGLNPLSYWPEIPGTNGGRGKIVNYTLNITSLKGTTRKVAAYFEVAQSGNALPGRTLTTPCPPNDGM